MAYTAEYIEAFNHVLEVEGGRSNHKWDPGGDTMYGISKRWFPEYWKYGPPTIEDARKFYWVEFWNNHGLDRIRDYPLRLEMFDTAVNVGPGDAVVFAQRAFNLLRRRRWLPLKEDGVLGPKTGNALNMMYTHYPEALLAGCNYYQAEHYANIGGTLGEEAIRGWFAKRLCWRSID